MSSYGSPKQGDGTSRQEALVDRANKKFMFLLNNVAPKVLNRPIGSKVLSKPEKIEDFKLRYYEQPEALAQSLTEHVSQMGWTQGLTEWAKWVGDSYREVDDASNNS